jgi:hypothetical protein
MLAVNCDSIKAQPGKKVKKETVLINVYNIGLQE